MARQKYLFKDVENTDVWNTLRELFYLTAATKADKQRLGQLTRDFKAHGATAERIREYTGIYRTRAPYNKWHCSVDAILKHWGELEHEANKAKQVAEFQAWSRRHEETAREKRARFDRLKEIPASELPGLLDEACGLMPGLRRPAAPPNWSKKPMWVTAVLKAWDARK
jgi:hypothetical protein